ncbi:hypothetical protein SH449x_002014 [Pirellulaceae bacterium SH449]
MSVSESSYSRLLVVTRRFWPLSDGSCHRVLNWAHQLSAKGIRPSILTARWGTVWPETTDIRHLAVHRILPSPHSNWNESYFQKNVVQWIQHHASEFDAIYVDQTDALLQVLISKGTQWGLPIIGRFAPSESAIGAAPASRLSPQVVADVCKKCSVVMVTNATDHRYLISQGVHQGNIVRLEDPPFIWLNRSSERRIISKRSLANLSSDFVVPNQTLVITHIGATEWGTLRQALDCICDLLDAGGALRMWIINPNLSHAMIYEYLKDRGWHREILIFDSFDDLEELAHAADLLWVTNPEESAQFALPMFLAASVPVIVRETDSWPALMQDLLQGSLYGSPTDLALMLHGWYADVKHGQERAAKIRTSLALHYGGLDNGLIWRDLLERVCVTRHA